MYLQEIVLWQLEDDGEEREKFGCNLVMNMAGEPLDDGTIVSYNVWLGKLEGWNEFGDVVDFRIVINTWTDFLRLYIRDDRFCPILSIFNLPADPLACSHCSRLFQAPHGTLVSPLMGA